MIKNIPQMSQVKNFKPLSIVWDKWTKGLNKLITSTRVEDDELVDAENVILVDQGNPIRRAGTEYLGDDTAGTGVSLLTTYFGTNTNHLLKIEDGIAHRLIGATWQAITGASFSSGIETTAVMHQNILYISNGIDPLTKYSGTSFSVFSGINAPTTNWATLGASLVSGPYLHSYRVTALNSIGETLACAATTVAVDKKRDTWNIDPTKIVEGNSVLINWQAATGATSYNIYGYLGADETYLDTTTTTSWSDYGDKEPSNVFTLPTGNTTTGPKGKFIIEYKSTLMIGGDPNAKDRIYYSAGVDKPESFLISDGGGWIDVSADGAEGDITGISVYQNKTIIFKDYAIWGLDFNTGLIPSVSNIVKGFGCIAHKTIRAVENDLFFLGTKQGGYPAIYVLGNEANYQTIIRTNELSAKVKPVLQELIPENYKRANAQYVQGRYFLFYASGSGGNNRVLVYDHERKGFTEWNINTQQSEMFVNTDKSTKFVIAQPRISYVDENLTTDNGVAIIWKYRVKDLDLEDVFVWKKYKWINMRFRQGAGLIKMNIYINGDILGYTQLINLASLNIATSFRSDKFGVGRFRKSVSISVGADSFVILRIPVSNLGSSMVARSMGLEIIGSEVESNGALMEVEFVGKTKSKKFHPRKEIIYN